MDSPLMQLCFLGIVTYVFYLWLSDLRKANSGNPGPGALPGASPASIKWIAMGAIGAVTLVSAETLGEHVLGISSEQTSMTLLLGLVTVAAGFGEELIFRGYLVIPNKGKLTLWLSVFAFSILFALIHPYLWNWEDGTLHLILTSKAIFSTSVVLLNSIWFYYLRFSVFNENKSLWPCIVAHASSNAAVFSIKLAQGFVSGLY
jgi:uncharacterized protein